MSQYFKDSLEICRAIGLPSLFLTMTCNSKWPEIQEMLKMLPNVDPVDVPNIVSRMCGLPHMHMLIWLSPESRPNSIEKVDQLVSAEIPDKNSVPIAYEVVKNYMMHGPCGKDLYTSPYMVKGKCIFNGNTYFDDCGFPVNRRCNTGRVINKKGINLDNQYVVPYNRDLILQFQCHINLEICNSSRSLKYLFKYCLKGHDTATILLKKKSNKLGNEQTTILVKNLNDVKNFLDGRYIKKTDKWKLRQRGDVVWRLAEIRTIDGTTYDTFKEVCGALGLLNNDKQWHDALEENAVSAMPTQIRAMFVNILENCYVSDPLALWEKHWPTLSNDVIYMRRKISDNIHLTLSEYEIQNYALAEIEKLLNNVGKSLRDFHMMPFPDEQFFHKFVNRLIVEETSYNKEEMRLNHEKAHKNMNSRKLDVYNTVVDNVNKSKGGMFFIYGSGECGSEIAPTLLPGVRTAHSRFKIPMKLDQSSIAGIKHGTDIVELI
ncbi:uncharacterized protein LOC141685581 [Apium graveolens]|uniref:uncharacterized protein LOC141685581 n=1 Tax=Apium graveolens TaxID=4045 RepID=UPI003D7AB468